MNIKNILVSAVLIAAATTAFADDGASRSAHATSTRTPPNLVTNGMVQAPGPSLVYFSDASYPVQPQVKSDVSRAEVKAALIQAGSTSK
jgi:hypothetical protein